MKIVSLDFWGTIAVFNPAYSKARTAFLANLFGLSSKEADQHYKSIKHALDQKAEAFGTAYTPLSCVKQLLEGRNLTYDTNAVEVLDAIEQMVRDNPPIIEEEMFDLLTEAREHGHVVGISSNTNFIRGSLLLDIFGDLITMFNVHSDEIGVSKPDPDFFRTVIKRAREASGERYYCPRAMTHIGDNTKCDVAGATRAGMKGLLTHNPQETILILRETLNIPSPRASASATA